MGEKDLSYMEKEAVVGNCDYVEETTKKRMDMIVQSFAAV
jgi:hypothetical protein